MAVKDGKAMGGKSPSTSCKVTVKVVGTPTYKVAFTVEIMVYSDWSTVTPVVTTKDGLVTIIVGELTNKKSNW